MGYLLLEGQHKNDTACTRTRARLKAPPAVKPSSRNGGSVTKGISAQGGGGSGSAAHRSDNPSCFLSAPAAVCLFGYAGRMTENPPPPPPLRFSSYSLLEVRTAAPLPTFWAGSLAFVCTEASRGRGACLFRLRFLRKSRALLRLPRPSVVAKSLWNGCSQSADSRAAWVVGLGTCERNGLV